MGRTRLMQKNLLEILFCCIRLTPFGVKANLSLFLFLSLPLSLIVLVAYAQFLRGILPTIELNLHSFIGLLDFILN